MNFSKEIKTHLFFMPIIFVLFVASYYKTIEWMFYRYISPDSYYSHGFLIPFISAYLIWEKREYISTLPNSFSVCGIIIVIVAFIAHITGTIFYVFSISGFSIFILIIGIGILIFGKEVTKIISFPLLFLIFMFPIPLAFILKISYPLKMITAQFGVEAISIFGIPIYREGFYITIPSGQLIIGNPCSGLRSIITFLALGSVVAYKSQINFIKKIILLFLIIPISIFSNVIRVIFLILVSNYWGLDAASPETYAHTLAGIIVFVIGFFLIIVTNKIMSWKV